MTGRFSARHGSALVATLFFISVLLGLLLLLVTLTRIGSDTASLNRDVQLSRRVIQSGLALALAEMEDSYLVPTNRVYSLPAQEAGWVSSGTGGIVTGLVEEGTAEWLGWPESLRGTGPESLHARAGTAQWQVLGDSNEIHTAIAWVGVDLTGLLDPNATEDLMETDSLGFASQTNRWYFTAREVMLDQTNAVPVFVPGDFVRDDGWYDESVKEWRVDVELGTETVGLFPGDWSTNQVQAVMAELFPDRNANELALAFDDYWNGREVPTDPEQLTAVAVPMINEVDATLTLRNLDGVLTVSNRIEFEVWYPFPGNVQTHQYRMPRTPEMVRKDTPTPSTYFAARDSDDEWEFICPSGSINSAFARLRLDVSATTTNFVEGEVLDFEWKLEGLELERLDGSGVVDRLPAGLRLTMPSVPVPVSGAVEEVRAGIEVEDPRINHIPANWVASTEDSIMAVNAAAVAAQAQDEFRDGFACWVPPATDPISDPLSPTERIGHFPLGESWRSFDLFGSEGRWWMTHTRHIGRYFMVVGEGGMGLLNPNSRTPEAVAAVFEGRVPREWPGKSGTPLTDLEALEVAEEMEAAVLSDRGFIQRGDWNWAIEAKLLDLAGTGGRHAAESVLAATLPFFGTRSQMWGVIVLAETRGPAGQTLASSRRVYRVWRDPFENPDGRRRGRILFAADLMDTESGW